MAFMLLELKIENFGIIERLRMRPGSGLNVITGETGAGKSLILQAIETVLGARTGSGVVRNGSQRASVEALFDLSEQKGIREWLETNRFPSYDNYISLRREISADGRSRSYINGMPTKIAPLRRLSSHLIEFLGQHDHQRILDPDIHLECLDLFAGAIDLRDKVSELYNKYNGIKKRLHTVTLKSEERERRLDFLKFALEEIESFEPTDGEFEELLQEKAFIQNSGRLFSDISQAYISLREGEESILDRLMAVERLLENHDGYHTELDIQKTELREALYRLESLSDFLRDEKGRLHFTPERLDIIEDRIAGYRRLHKKYGGNSAAVINTAREFLREISAIEMSDEEMEKLQEELEYFYTELREMAEELSRKRRSVIPGLELSLKNEIAELGMPGAAIFISVQREMDAKYAAKTSGDEDTTGEKSTEMNFKKDSRSKYLINDKGLDRVEFLLRANTGEATLPLRKIASGGEMSRIMLALKSILMPVQSADCVIFDEVDAGVGGEVAHSIAARLKKHSENHQVLVITHLHQVASVASHHFFVSKRIENGRTTAHLDQLEGEKRIYEMARMLGGNEPGPVVMEHARELLLMQTG